MNDAVKVPLGDDHVGEWAQIAAGARMIQHSLRAAPKPTAQSPFAQTAELYPYERIADRARSYLSAAVEHLVFWSDLQAPLKFDTELSIEITLRPSYTLARASLESAAQGVWLMDTTDPRECIRRHISLMRWDLVEHRKSKLDLAEKERVRALEQQLVRRVSEVFDDDAIRPPQGYREVIRAACQADGVDIAPDDAERVWRAASGAAHGKYWPARELQSTVSVDHPEKGSARVVQIPDVVGMTEALNAGLAMTQAGVLRFLDYSGADIARTLDDARAWLTEVIPLKPGSTREDLRRRMSSRRGAGTELQP